MAKFKELIGKHCQVYVKVKEKIFYYSADIEDVDDTHMTFLDKYNRRYIYHLEDIREVKGF